MTQKDVVSSGGPAFPRPLVGSDQAGTVDFGAEGMSLRDYFAHHSPEMPDWWRDLWAKRERMKTQKDSRYQMRDEVFAYVDWRLEYADAMLRARTTPAEEGK